MPFIILTFSLCTWLCSDCPYEVYIYWIGYCIDIGTCINTAATMLDNLSVFVLHGLAEWNTSSFSVSVSTVADKRERGIFPAISCLLHFNSYICLREAIRKKVGGPCLWEHFKLQVGLPKMHFQISKNCSFFKFRFRILDDPIAMLATVPSIFLISLLNPSDPHHAR